MNDIAVALTGLAKGLGAGLSASAEIEALFQPGRILTVTTVSGNEYKVARSQSGAVLYKGARSGNTHRVFDLMVEPMGLYLSWRGADGDEVGCTSSLLEVYDSEGVALWTRPL